MRHLPTLVALAVARLSGPQVAWSEEVARADYAVDAGVSGGYRTVDIDGAKDKYREDYNLRSGGRLFGLDVTGRAKAPEATPLDRFRLEVATPGDEPVSHFRLSASDRPRYDLRADFTRSRYVYAVPQLFEQAAAGTLRLDDLHDFDLVRTNGLVDLTVRAPHLPRIFFGYRLYERHGDATSTVLLPGGDTFVVAAPVDTTTHVGRLGTEFRAAGADVFVQQEYRRVDRQHDLGPPRAPGGLEPADASTLTFLQSKQNERVNVPVTTVRVRKPVGESVELAGAYSHSHADVDVGLARRRAGTTNVTGLSGAAAAIGDGEAALDTHVADLRTSARPSDWLHLHVDYRFHDRSRTGRLDERSTLGVLAAETGDHVRTHSVTSDFELQPRADLSLRAGVRFARRDTHFAEQRQDVSTDTVGAVGALRWRPWSFVDLFARYENVQVDDPIAVPADPRSTPPLPEREIALTFTNRATAGVQLTPRAWATVRYQLTADRRENDTFAARGRSVGNSVAVSAEPVPNLMLFAGYTRRDVDDRAAVLVAPLYRPTLSQHEGTEDVVTGTARYDFALRGLGWSAGCDVAWVNADTRLTPNLEPARRRPKRFDLDRIDVGGFVALRHRWVEPSIEVRFVDYDERTLPRNDYRATIVVVKLTKRWNF
jgi:hypothetical protein